MKTKEEWKKYRLDKNSDKYISKLTYTGESVGQARERIEKKRKLSDELYLNRKGTYSDKPKQ